MPMTYDCFMVLNELDLLEIRLNILDPHVDYFVLGQSTETFSGKEKPLYFDIEDKRWAKWKDKIIEVVIPKIPLTDSFERAGFQKDYLRTALSDCKDDDIIFFGDVDEIWQYERMFREDYAGMPDKQFNLQQLNYSYYLNNRSSEEWVGTCVAKYKNLRDFNVMRADHTHILKNGGWHFTNCMGYDNIVKKLESYDHQEFNTDEIKSKLKERMENGEDYVGRSVDWNGKPFEMWKDESDLPKFLIEHKDDYKHLFR